MASEAKAREMFQLAQDSQQMTDEAVLNKNLYKQTLQSQIIMNELNKKNFGKMTQVEKKLNRQDLQNYKQKQPTAVNSMVPGIMHREGVGSKALQMGAMRMMQDPLPMHRAKGGIAFKSPEKEEYYQMGPSARRL